jgi:hypothetical protein
MKNKLITLSAVIVLAVAAWSQTRAVEAQLPAAAGTFVRMIVSSTSRLVALGPSLIIGGTPTAPTLDVNPASIPAVLIRNKAVALTFTSGTLTLPDVPLPNTTVDLFVGGLYQEPGVDYTLNGVTITPTVAAVPIWTASGRVIAKYFF